VPRARWLSEMREALADEHHVLRRSIVGACTRGSTLQTYQRSLLAWLRFINERLPTTDWTTHTLLSATPVVDYVAFLFDRDLAVSTIKSHVTALGFLADCLGCVRPISLRPVRLTLQSVGARRLARPKYNTIFDLGSFLRAALRQLDRQWLRTRFEDWPELLLRDWAILLLRSFLPLRSADVAQIDLSSVSRDRSGAVSFRLLSSKGQRDRSRAAEPLVLAPAPQSPVCPAQALWAYAQRMRRALPAASSATQLFRTAPPSRTPLSDQRVATVIRTFLDNAPSEICPRKAFSPHSLKAASVSFLRRHGHSCDDIAAAINAVSTDVLRKHYDRSGPAARLQQCIASALAAEPSESPSEDSRISAAATDGLVLNSSDNYSSSRSSSSSSSSSSSDSSSDSEHHNDVSSAGDVVLAIGASNRSDANSSAPLHSPQLSSAPSSPPPTPPPSTLAALARRGNYRARTTSTQPVRRSERLVARQKRDGT
jgi:hypothetical protein